MQPNFNNFKLDTWYKILIYFGGLISIGSIFLPTVIFDNVNVFIFGLGIFILGLGKWKSLKGSVSIPGEEKRRRSLKELLIVLLEIIIIFIGLFLLVYSTYEIIKHYIA